MSFRYAHLTPSPKRVGQIKTSFQGTTAIPANTCFISSIWIPNMRTYRYIKTVATLGAGNIQAGIYNEQFQAVKLSSPQAVVLGKITIDLGAFIMLAGNYWIAIAVDSAIQFFGMDGTPRRLGNTSKSCLTSYPLPSTLTIAQQSEPVGPHVLLEGT